jgi:hypothetical protein
MADVASVCQPSTLRMLIWPQASSAQNNMAAVSADGSTVCVLILRLNSSCSRSIAFVTGMTCAGPVAGGRFDGVVSAATGTGEPGARKVGRSSALWAASPS